MEPIERALAEEARREIAGQSLDAKAVYEAMGISQSAYYNYFTKPKRALKLGQIIALAEVLGMEPEELVARARARVASQNPLEAMLGPVAREVVEEEQAKARRARAANGTTEDPPDAATKGRHSA
jgi:hypothetical protein